MAKAEVTAPTAKIGIVECIRGIASISVCFFHFKENIITAGMEKHDRSGLLHAYVKIAGYGWVGVEAFFVVSGFIIPYALLKGGYTTKNFFSFFAKRCLRIEPPYLASVLLVIILGYASAMAPGYHGQPYHISPGNLLSHIGYLPEHLGYTWLQPVYWSLEAEFHYYLLIGLALPFIWKNKIRLFAAFLLMFISGFFIPLYVFSFMPFFVMGIITCAKKMNRVNDVEFILVLVCAVATCFIRHQPLEMPLVGLCTALAINYLKFNNRVFNFLGKISFSLYLLHVPIGGRVMNLASRYADSEIKVWASLLLALIITLFASWIFYLLVERPSQRLSRKISYA